MQEKSEISVAQANRGNVCVMVDCGWSDWFKTRDIRIVGPFHIMEAREYAAALNDRQVTGREGEPIKATVQPINPSVPVEEYSV